MPECTIIAMDKPTTPLKPCDPGQNGVPPVQAQTQTPQHGKKKRIVKARAAKLDDTRKQERKGVHHALDMTPQEIVAEELEAQHQREKGFLAVTEGLLAAARPATKAQTNKFERIR